MNHGSTTRRLARRVVCLLAVFAGLLVMAAPGAAALPRSDVQSQQWWIMRLQLKNVWKITEGRGVTVAVVDSGVDARFADLRGAVTAGFGVGVSGNGQRDVDPSYHGTRMADTIAGRGTGFGLLGIAPKASILPVALNYGEGNGSVDDTQTALTRLTAMANPPDVVNMSFGQPGECPSGLQAAVSAATAKGMILVASAGNTPTENSFPANCTGVVAVGAFGNDIRPWDKTAQQDYVSLSGPGVKMIGYSTSAPSGYGYASGTSDSAAVVSGVFALARAKFPSASARDLVTRVLYTARQFGGSQGTRNDIWGYGAARPFQALTAAVPASAPNPIYDALDNLGTPPAGSTTPTTGAPTTAPATTPATALASTPAGSSPAPDASSDGGSSTGLVIGLVAAVVVLAVVIVALVVRGRRRAPAGPPAGPPGWG